MVAEEKRGVTRREFVRRSGVAGIALSMSGLLAACGGGESAAGGETSSNGVLSVGSPDWLPPDFYIGTALGNQIMGFTQFAWALFIGGGGDGRGFELRNGLASGYEASADKLVHTVSLRDGITFHDGSSIDADAVVQNLRAAFFKDAPLRDRGPYTQVALGFGDPPIVQSVDASDSKTVTIRLTEPRPDIRVALSFIFILNPKIMSNEEYGVDVEALGQAGSGPFRLVRFEQGSFAEFERFESFVEPVVPARLRLQQTADSGALSLALRGGDINVANGLAKSDYDSLAGSGYQRIVSNPAIVVDLVLGTPTDEAFADQRVRRAMELAMNREAYVERFFASGTAQISSQSIVPPGLGGYDTSLKPAPYDPAAAKALLAEAGVSSASLKVTTSTSLPGVSSPSGLLEAIAADVGAIGIDVAIEKVDLATYYSDYTKFESFLLSFGGQADPLPSFGVYFDGRSPQNLVSVPSLQDPLGEARQAVDIAKRDELLRKVARTLRDEAIAIPIATAGISVLAAADVHEFPLSGSLEDSWNGVSVSA